MKQRKRTKAYENYRRKFYAEKKIGNVKQGVRVLTVKQYRNAKKKGLSDKKILNAQTMLHSKAEKRRVWNEYRRITRKRISRGESIIMEDTYFGGSKGSIFGEYEEGTEEDIEGLSYHYNLSGLLKDKDAIHYLISYRIMEGEEREEVLADYGY